MQVSHYTEIQSTWDSLLIFFIYLFFKNISIFLSLLESRKKTHLRLEFIEQFGLVGISKTILFHPPCHGQGHLPLDQVAEYPSFTLYAKSHCAFRQVMCLQKNSSCSSSISLPLWSSLAAPVGHQLLILPSLLRPHSCARLSQCSSSLHRHALLPFGVFHCKLDEGIWALPFSSGWVHLLSCFIHHQKLCQWYHELQKSPRHYYYYRSGTVELQPQMAFSSVTLLQKRRINSLKY